MCLQTGSSFPALEATLAGLSPCDLVGYFAHYHRLPWTSVDSSRPVLKHELLFLPRQFLSSRW